MTRLPRLLLLALANLFRTLTGGNPIAPGDRAGPVINPDPFDTPFFRQFPRFLGVAYIVLMSQWIYSSYQEGKLLKSCLLLGIALVGGGLVIARDWSKPLNLPTWETASLLHKLLVVGSASIVGIIFLVSPHSLP